MVTITELPTRAPKHLKKQDTKAITRQLAERIGELQALLFAERKHSLLVVLQGMDASGKDGITRKVFRNCSATGLRVATFKKPTKQEFAHDFLWRIHHHAPEQGMIQIFNRSHYEDVLIQRVHQWIDEECVKRRFQAINDFELLLQEHNNTTILKFYLHLSEERQLEKLQERIDLPHKNWKHNDGDWEERKHWGRYMQCYEDVINQCNAIPWHPIPADQRWYRDYTVAQQVVKTLEALNMSYPELEPEVRNQAR